MEKDLVEISTPIPFPIPTSTSASAASASAPDASATASVIDVGIDIDRSGYNYDLVLTYKMIEDTDDQDTLFRIQFLQAFGITDDEYHPDIVSAVIDDLYERFRENPGIRAILESHPLFHSHPEKSAETTGSGDTGSDDTGDTGDTTETGETGEDDPPAPCSCIHTNDNSEMIFCMMFSFQLFDLFHACLRHAKHGEEIPQSLRDEIAECFRTMF